MLSSFLIGIREGLEAALIVGILVAYLVKLGRSKDAPKIFIGVGSAVVLSVAAAMALSAVEAEASETTEVILSGTFSLVAVGFVTWMIFWMAKQGRHMAKDLHGKVDRAVQISAWSLAIVSFLAVIREGLETAIFIWSTSRATDGTLPVFGAILGLVLASLIGYLIYKGALKLNIGAFFKYTGAFLIIVAAGIAGYGIHEFQELNLLPFLTQTAYDLSPIVPEGSVLDVVLRGAFVFRAAPSVLEVVVWVTFVAIVGALYARVYSKAKPASKSAAKAAEPEKVSA